MTINIKPITEDQLCGMGGYTATSGESEIKIGQDYYRPCKWFGKPFVKKVRVVAVNQDLKQAVVQERILQGYVFGLFKVETYGTEVVQMTFKELRECVRSY